MSSYAESGRAPRTLTEREQRLLLKVTGEHRAGFRDHVLYAMALGTGLREHELVALDVRDVFDSAGKARRRIVLRVFKGSDRASAGQDVLVPEGLRAKLHKLWAWKVREAESVEANAPLFVSRLGQRLSLRQVRHGFRVWQERAGFERRVTFHMLRHTACSNLYAQSKDIRLTQRFARHRSLSRRWSTRTRATTTSLAPSSGCGADVPGDCYDRFFATIASAASRGSFRRRSNRLWRRSATER